VVSTLTETTLIPDEQRLKEYKKQLKHQYNTEATFAGVHACDKTDGGVYVFDMVMAETTRRCGYWRFIPSIAKGQHAMNVAVGDAVTGAEMVDEWIAYRKYADKHRG
jgi:hypothetical protein